ncbi:MAG: hypothetical protein FP816_14410 [Desulfobacteraceae bacterium]|nr:hypothetical protein [Desulfobacteraceae bacterium]MBU4001956.1 hypothetical protein [Pseudomonadota bacterium]
MKKNNFAFLFWIILVVIAVITGTAWAEDVDMTGTWKVVVGSGSDGGTPTFVLKQEGNVLTGTYKGRFGESSVNGTVEGNNFKITLKAGGSSSIYKGKVEGTQMSGEATFGGMSTMQFTGEMELGLMP